MIHRFENVSHNFNFVHDTKYDVLSERWDQENGLVGPMIMMKTINTFGSPTLAFHQDTVPALDSK